MPDMRNPVFLSAFPIILAGLASCITTAERTVPKTPETYSISGTVTGTESREHLVASVAGESLAIKLDVDFPEVVFDIIDPESDERLYTGSVSPLPNEWAIEAASGKSYRAIVYNSAPIVHLPVTADYRLNITRSD